MVFEILAVGEAALLKQKAESEANFRVLSKQKAFEAAAAEIKHEALMDIQFKLQTLPMDTSASEEMDLAVKWPSSRQHARTYNTIQLLTKFGEDRTKFSGQTNQLTDRQSDSYIAPITNGNGGIFSD
ncbi:hypothetical protein DPMN_088590 [Dreissena polymorpha]|uniref:Uncharacterized protein n=1 Tax=Dreissena polymorpha TaxID=45954 RepID=A0A9D4KUC9_DREPO|nr:hypothetical protein DPMN_088590 [Dreissena polymorpha]